MWFLLRALKMQLVCIDASSLLDIFVLLVPCKQNFPGYLEFKQNREAFGNTYFLWNFILQICYRYESVKLSFNACLCRFLDVGKKTVSTGCLGHSETSVQCFVVLKGSILLSGDKIQSFINWNVCITHTQTCILDLVCIGSRVQC